MNSALNLESHPIKKLLFHYATPCIIAMVVTSLYNLVDSIFIGHFCGSLALGGITVAKPIMDICAAFGSFIGIGSSTLISIKLGQKDIVSANKILGNVIVLNVIVSIMVSVCGLIFLRPILFLFGASCKTINFAYDYMQVILIGNILTHLYFGLNNVLRSIGQPDLSMKATLFATILNVVLDPLFILGLNMGIQGVAIATILSQMVSVIWQLTFFLKKDSVIHFQKNIWKPDYKLILDILYIGLSPLFMNLAHCLVIVFINRQLYRFGEDFSIATYGIINRFIFVFFMLVMGLSQGMQPIVGYNYGAKKYKRTLQCFKLTCFFATTITSLVFLCGELIPKQMIEVFTHDITLIQMSIKPMRIACSTMIIVGFQIITVQFFTSIGKSYNAIFLSLTRQVLFLIPLVILLPIVFRQYKFFPLEITGVWISIPLSDTLAAITTAIMLTIEIKKMKRQC